MATWHLDEPWAGDLFAQPSVHSSPKFPTSTVERDGEQIQECFSALTCHKRAVPSGPGRGLAQPLRPEHKAKQPARVSAAEDQGQGGSSLTFSQLICTKAALPVQ